MGLLDKAYHNEGVRILALVAVVVGLIFLIVFVLLGDKVYKAEVTKTSRNTYHIYAPNNDPERYYSRTCQRDGKRIIQLIESGNYGTDVVCG